MERDPITGANRDAVYSGPELTGSEYETTLHREQPVVSKETVPVERVRLAGDTVTAQRTVDENLSREQVEADLPGEGHRGTRSWLTDPITPAGTAIPAGSNRPPVTGRPTGAGFRTDRGIRR